jgi:hypothetical protein
MGARQNSEALCGFRIDLKWEPRTLVPPWRLTTSDRERRLFNRLSSQPVRPDILDDVEEAAARAISELGLLSDSEPRALATAIRTHIDAVRPLSGEELDETATVLGCLWAHHHAGCICG